MKLTIFNTSLISMMALMTVSSGSFAQEPPAKPVKPEDMVITVPEFKFDTKAFNESMKQFNLDMKNLKVDLKGLDKEITLSMNDFSKDLKINLDSSFSFNLDIPKIDLKLDLSGLKTDIQNNSGLIFNNRYSDEELKNKIQSGEITEKIKNYSKSYSVDANDKLLIDNRYGKVIVNTWNKNEVKVDVEIKAETGSDSETQKLLDGVRIEDSKNSGLVSFITRMNNDWNAGMNWNGGNRIRKIEINYTVYMPSKISLEVSNRYGATELPDLQGKIIVNSSYGSLVAKSLSNIDNQIKVRYGSANIESLGSSDVSVAYGNLQLGSVNNINANVSYGSAKIGRIRTTGNISIRYCSPIEIGDIDKELKSLSVNCSYSGVKLGLSGDENADFDVTVKNGSFDYNNGVSITSKTPPDNAKGWSPTKNYKGKVGKGNADKVITITSTYGSVKFD